MPVAWGDIGVAVRLLDWMRDLGGIPNHELVFCLPPDLPQDLKDALTSRAATLRGTWSVFQRPFILSSEHWPQGPNWSFTCASQWAHQNQKDFLFLEPDCVPLKPGWVETIHREYRGCGRAFLGHFEAKGAQHERHMAGVAVYQWEIYQRLHWHEYYKAWDVAMGPYLLHEAHESRTIQQIWGDLGRPPTFATTHDLRCLRPDAVLFHRNKDGTLIERLREIWGVK
jgi:hypothetical protein